MLWKIIQFNRRMNWFNYWTRKRRREENCCPKCGVVNDNSLIWKRIVDFKKRESDGDTKTLPE